MRPPLAGLYGITSADICENDQRLLQAVVAALRGGTRWLQYRDKQADAEQRLRRAHALASLCRQHGAGFIVNDDVTLALAADADGVHIGASDGDIARTRAQLGPDRVLGVTCGNDLSRARSAAAAGADYIAFGRLFASRTKPDAPPARLKTVHKAVQTLPVAVCVIGGIRPLHLAEVTATGARLIAVVDGLFGSDDVEGAARIYCQELGRTISGHSSLPPITTDH